ncbi:MAG: PilX N-terminal domain-containing pilus assembly protein [Pseudomonadota bacterium]
MKTMSKNAMKLRKHQDGAALVIGLILLVVITVLAISGMNTATTELAMARNDQNYERAFQAAETGLAMALAQGQFNTLANAQVTQTISTHESVTADIAFEDSSIVPDKAFSLGSGSGVAAYHFLATSQAESSRDPGNDTDRDASATHTQAFYVVGPESSTL